MNKLEQEIITAVVQGRLTSQQRAAIREILKGHAPSQPSSTAVLLSQADVARLLRCSRFTVRRLVENGKLQPVNLTNRLVRYRSSDVMALSAGLREESPLTRHPVATQKKASMPEHDRLEPGGCFVKSPSHNDDGNFGPASGRDSL